MSKVSEFQKREPIAHLVNCFLVKPGVVFVSQQLQNTLRLLCLLIRRDRVVEIVVCWGVSTVVFIEPINGIYGVSCSLLLPLVH